MMVPDKTTIASVRLHRLHSNLAVDPGNVAEGGQLDTNLAVFQFVQALNFGGGQSFVFLVVPASRIEADAGGDVERASAASAMLSSASCSACMARPR